jgi:hypothetical protein
MKRTLIFLAATLSSLAAHGQVTFSNATLPHEVGDYNRAYLATNVDVSGVLGNTGGPQHWDFSQPQAAGEVIQGTDIVPPTDGGNQGLFPKATYAERTRNESTGALNWSYYQIVGGQGREYYGFVDTNSNPDAPVKAFSAPTVDLPGPVQFGLTWTRSVDFTDFAVIIDFAVHFTAQAKVDAYGTVSLPGMGDWPALRVNEMHEYDYIDTSFGIANYTNYFRDYYWLVPGVGKAVEIISPGSNNGAPPANFTSAATLTRVFETGAVQPAAQPVSALRIHVQDGQVILDWSAAANATGYRVEFTSPLTGGTWALSAEPFVNTWTEPVGTNAQRFYRVFAEP